MELHGRTAQRDVDDLSSFLDRIVAAQASAEAVEAVEILKTGAIAYRQGEADSRGGLYQVLDALDHRDKSTVARVFATYFELVNLAEERERVRAIRGASQAETLDDGLETAVEALAGSEPEHVQSILDDVLVEPTFTAHPTEARRKTVKTKLRAIATHLETLDERSLTDKETSQILRNVDAEVTSLWQTPQIRGRRPDPEDEARNVLWYLENTLFDVVGEVYDELETELRSAFDGTVEVPKLYEFRSWAGSDRDGNPYVTPETTAKTLESQRAAVLERYRDELKALSGVVSQDGTRVDIGEAFERSLVADRDLLSGVAETAAARYPNEPYRQKLRLMRERLDRVDDVRPGGYADPDELLADLDAIATSLRTNDGDTIAEAHVDPLCRQVETFGFSLASLDLRDHRKRHTAAVAELFDREGVEYDALDEDERAAVLTEAIEQDEPVADLAATDGLSETAAEVATLFDRLVDWHAEYGDQAIDTYCISMCEHHSHVLEVLFLADQAGVVDPPAHSGLDVVPLLETESALSRAEEIMGALFENDAYAGALSARGEVQEIMLGYSDSNKENGFLAANWDLFRNQRRLASIADDYDVTLRLFHGRGGSISRGGGPMHDALLALPPDTVTGPVKFTEQGEAIAEKYANPRIAERELEQMVSAQVRARDRAVAGDATHSPDDEWTAAMETMAAAARAEYRNLLETEGFVPYFEEATPITVIEELNLGSRPASRSGERTVEDLRAIPWVFSWTQSRCILPGWYAVATGIDAYLAEGGDTETLRTMYEEWPFFRTTLDRAAQALARTDMEIAGEYARLAAPERYERFFGRIEDEYHRAVELVTTIAGREDLLRRKWLRESLDRRNPFVDPLNLLQCQLLGRTHRTDLEERTLRLTVKGIAAGMKNTG
jgi:phosphoenolpyruvate carboxylase